MLPLLTHVSDGKEYRVADVITALADNLALTEAERSELLPSGKQTVISNRVHWAKTYMAQAKLLEITRHAHFRITERQLKRRNVLASLLPMAANCRLISRPDLQSEVNLM